SFTPAAAAPAAPAGPTPLGDWLVQDGTAHIRIQQCGPSLWGIISWVKQNGLDENNPNPTKRNRPVLGIPILLDMIATRPNRWDGQVYNAEDGNTYTAYIGLKSGDVLRIEGCGLGGLICSGENWTRLPPPSKTDPLIDVCSLAAK